MFSPNCYNRREAKGDLDKMILGLIKLDILLYPDVFDNKFFSIVLYRSFCLKKKRKRREEVVIVIDISLLMLYIFLCGLKGKKAKK